MVMGDFDRRSRMVMIRKLVMCMQTQSSGQDQKQAQHDNEWQWKRPHPAMVACCALSANETAVNIGCRTDDSRVGSSPQIVRCAADHQHGASMLGLTPQLRTRGAAVVRLGAHFIEDAIADRGLPPTTALKMRSA